MEYSVEKEIFITLKLTEKGFNTILASRGVSSHDDRTEFSERYERDILGMPDAFLLFEKLNKIADRVEL